MPEGDTIHRSARRLAQALAGRTVTRFETPRLVRAAGGSGPGPGSAIEGVEARGKYLLIHFDDGSMLETHQMMQGSWHLYRRGERWRRSSRAARVVIETDEWVAVCFSAPHLVLHPAGRARQGRRRGLDPAHLGPDLCGPAPDLDRIPALVDQHLDPDTPAAVALLDQRVFCGVGNVFKSEVLHACGMHPETPVGSISGDDRRRLAETAHRQLRANLGGGPRTTVPGGLAVYGRSGRPCRVCGTAVSWARLGRPGSATGPRSTYWCPSCQPAPGRTTPDS